MKWSPRNGISALTRRDLTSSALYHMRIHRKSAIYKPRSGLSLDTESARVFTLDFPALRTVRNKC